MEFLQTALVDFLKLQKQFTVWVKLDFSSVSSVWVNLKPRVELEAGKKKRSK